MRLQSMKSPRDLEFNSLYNISLAKLQSMRPIAEGQTDNLVIQTERFRVWVSRMSSVDYDGDATSCMNERRSFEEFVDGRWIPHLKLRGFDYFRSNSARGRVPLRRRLRRSLPVPRGLLTRHAGAGTSSPGRLACLSAYTECGRF